MADINERIQDEYENIERVLAEMPAAESLENLSTLELAGVATLLHNFYNALENIIKQVLQSQQTNIPSGSSWHRDMLEIAHSLDLISRKTLQQLSEYLAFRHFFSHGYALDLKPELMKPLVEKSKSVFDNFRFDIGK